MTRMLHLCRWNRDADKLKRAERWLMEAMFINPTRQRRAVALIYSYERRLTESAPKSVEVSKYC